jgi:hypothetical protein
VPTEVAHLFLDELGHPSYVLKLVRSFYGLTTAPRAWWLDISRKLAQLGWKQLNTDRCLWVLFGDDGRLHGIIGVHVDDFVVGGARSDIFRAMRVKLRALYRDLGLRGSPSSAACGFDSTRPTRLSWTSRTTPTSSSRRPAFPETGPRRQEQH